MIGKTFALLQRALRVDARMIRSHVIRGGLVAVVMILIWTTQSQFRLGAPGLEFFSSVQYCNYWFITFAGATLFATAITEEKEEGTLGLLKMAGIGPLSMLLGKWAPRMIGALLLVSVQFPFTLLAITMGGVLWDQVIASYCTLLGHLVLVGSIGLLASVVSARSTGACTLAALLLGGYLLIPYIVAQTAEGLGDWGVISITVAEETVLACDSVIETSALTRLGQIMRTGFNESAFGVQVISNVAAAAVLFAAAGLLFGPCTRNEQTTSRGMFLARWLRLGRRSSRRAWHEALLWRDYIFVAGGHRVVVAKTIGYALLIGFLTLMGLAGTYRLDLEDVGEIMMGVMLFVLLVEAALIAARVYREETKAQTWSMLVMLPLSLRQIAYTKLMGSLLSLGPALGYFMLGAVFAPETVVEFIEEVLRDSDGFLAIMYLITQIFLFLHVTTLFSIQVNWAAWPVSIFLAGFIVFIGNFMLIACIETTSMSRGGGEVLLFMMSCFGATLTAIVHFWIGQRLLSLAAA